MYFCRVFSSSIWNLSEKIFHKAKVEEIGHSSVRVRVEQVSACEMCRADKFCTSADKREKIIDAVCPSPQDFSVGEVVEVVGTASMGMRAVFLAYILPLLLMLILLFVFLVFLFPEQEALAACSALALLAVYYGVVYLLRDKLKDRFVFEVRRLHDTN